MNNLGTTYFFWFACVFGFAGIHRIYNKKFFSGFLWMFTFGFLGIGQLIDLVLIPSMVDEHNIKLKQQLGLSEVGAPLEQQAIATTVYEPQQHNQVMTTAASSAPNREELMVQLLKAAHSRGGQISVTQAVLDTSASFAEVEATLKEMVNNGYVSVDNHPVSGVVVYQFVEL
ncbi:MAG: TM2 domain-containing protein [Symploca sp. SIO1A3]|nr:TM2 domain-containing protein [Symploca sp. SIO1A3]